MTSLTAAGIFLVNTVIDLYIFILIVRLILVYTQANYFNPFVQFIVKLTQVFVKPLRRLLPNVGRFETASAILIILFDLIKFTLLLLLLQKQPDFNIFLLVFADCLKMIIMTFFYAIIIQAILSWVQPYSPLNAILYQFNSPIMRPIQRVVPTIAGVDISPIPALILLQLLLIVLVNPLMNAGMS